LNWTTFFFFAWLLSKKILARIKTANRGNELDWLLELFILIIVAEWTQMKSACYCALSGLKWSQCCFPFCCFGFRLYCHALHIDQMTTEKPWDWQSEELMCLSFLPYSSWARWLLWIHQKTKWNSLLLSCITHSAGLIC
jgi:hypothetical protein